MKLSDIIVESDYETNVEDEASNVLIAAKATDLETIDLQQFVDYMNAVGFSMSKDTAKTLLKRIPFASVDGDEITIDRHEGSDSTSFDNDPEKNREVVSKLAQKAAKRDIG